MFCIWYKIPIGRVFSKLTYVKPHGSCYLANNQYVPYKLHGHHQNYIQYISSIFFFFFWFSRLTVIQATPCAMNINVKLEPAPSETAPTPTHPNLIFTFHCIWICLLASLLSTTAGQHNMLLRLLCSDGINVPWFNLYSLDDIS